MTLGNNKDERTSDYVCFDCGNEYLTDEQKKKEIIVTVHISECGLCQKDKEVIHIRNFNWLNKKQ